MLEEYLRAAKMFAISLAAGLASHITAILVILHLVEAMSEAFSVCWYYSREAGFNGFPHDGFFGDGIIFVAKTFRIEEEMALNDARRGFAMFLIMHLFWLKSFSFLSVSVTPGL